MTEVALAGDLRHFSTTEVLQLLQLAQASGRLALVRDGESADVWFERGRPLHARTSGASVRTGDILVHRGHVTREALARALRRQASEPDRRVGALLVDAGEAAPDEVAAAVRESVRRVLYGLLLWREGRFTFHVAEAPAGHDLSLDVDLDRLILEGLRLADQARATSSERDPRGR